MIHIGGRTYELIHENKTAWNPEAFRDRYSEVLERYDYIIGDWGYSQLRLKGFFHEQHPKANKDTSISNMVDYINEYCNFGCAYFVLQKTPGKKQRDGKDGNPGDVFLDLVDEDRDAAGGGVGATGEADVFIAVKHGREHGAKAKHAGADGAQQADGGARTRGQHEHSRRKKEPREGREAQQREGREAQQREGREAHQREGREAHQREGREAKNRGNEGNKGAGREPAKGNGGNHVADGGHVASINETKRAGRQQPNDKQREPQTNHNSHRPAQQAGSSTEPSSQRQSQPQQQSQQAQAKTSPQQAQEQQQQQQQREREQQEQPN